MAIFVLLGRQGWTLSVLILSVSILAGCSREPDPARVAQEMVDSVLPTGYPGAFAGLKAMSPSDVGQLMVGWSAAIEKIDTVKVDQSFALRMMTYPAQVRGLFQNGKYVPALGARYTKRISSVPKPLVIRWQQAMETTSGDQVAAVDALLQLMQTEDLWKEGDFVESQTEATLKKLLSIPATALQQWSQVSSDKSMVCLALLNVPSLFEGDSFVRSRFEQALPQASRLYAERESVLK